jgi:site-specific DNA recombinase
MKKAVIYLRVSTEEQAEKGFSIDAQRDECIQKAQELGCEGIIEYIDEGVSGSILERPMLINAMEEMKNRIIDFFICFDSSRLSRNVSHQLILIDTIKKYGTKLVFVRNNYEDTAEGRFQITIMAAVDEYERARLRIRTELGKRAKAKQKLLTHNPGLYGYDFDKESDHLTINELQAQIVRMMYNWLLEDKIGPAEIAKKLNQMQIISMRGKQWSRVSVNRILNNFSYTGTLYIRRYDTKDYKLNKYKKKGEKVRITERPKEEWIPINIPQIIELGTWQRAKTQLQKAKRAYKKGTKENYLLSGLLRCEKCGGTLHGRSTYKNEELQNKYYCCINKYNYNIDKEERCQCKLYGAEEIEILVWDLAKAWLTNKIIIKKILNDDFKLNKESEYEIKKLINQKEKEKQRLLNLYQKSIIDAAEFDKRLAEITKAIKFMYEDHKQALKIRKDDFIVQAGSITEKIETYLDSLGILDKNKLLHSIIKEIIINDSSMKIKSLLPINITNID